MVNFLTQLIIFQFCSCNFAYWLKFVITLKSIRGAFLQSFQDIHKHKVVKNLYKTMHKFLAKAPFSAFLLQPS